MRKSMIVLAATGLAVLGVNSFAGAAKTGPTAPPGRTLIAILGPKVSVPPGKFVKAYATCPKGYSVTGGGAYSGAITEIVSSPMPNLRGWFVDGVNDARTRRAFQQRADAVCMKVSPSAPTATTASHPWLTRQAEAEFVKGHQAAVH